MNNQATTLHGLVLRKTVQFDQELGLPNGQPVEVTIRLIQESETASQGEGLKRAFGAWADEADAVDDFLRWNRQQRKLGRPEISP